MCAFPSDSSILFKRFNSEYYRWYPGMCQGTSARLNLPGPAVSDTQKAGARVRAPLGYRPARAGRLAPARACTDPERSLMADGPVAASVMRDGAQAFLASLTEEQLPAATAPLDAADHRGWTYLPGSRPGLSLLELDDVQRTSAMSLLASGLSTPGLQTARSIMALEVVLGDLERSAGIEGWPLRCPQQFWIRVLGVPSRSAPWAWRLNGHHLATHMTVVGDEVACTPAFFGANPAIVPCGPHRGRRTLGMEEDLARDLVNRLDDDQRAVAVTSTVAPWDLATRHDPVADAGLVPRRLSHDDMDTTQRRLLVILVRHYFGRVPPEVAASARHAVVELCLSDVTFGWAGRLRPGGADYYAIKGPTFLLEYHNVQNEANHVHTVWRGLRHDWGSNLLAAHHAGRL